MTESELMDLTVLERKKYNYLNEVMDLSRQMGEALDRGDEVSMQMLLALRGEPIQHLQEVDQTARSRRSSLAAEDQQRLQELRSGAPPRDRGETLFTEQAEKARRLLERCPDLTAIFAVALDRQLSLRMSGDDSFYSQ